MKTMDLTQLGKVLSLVILVTLIVITLKTSNFEAVSDQECNCDDYKLDTTENPEQRIHTFDEDLIHTPEKLVQIFPWKQSNYNKNGSTRELSLQYHKVMNKQEMVCLHRTRLGHYYDGGWDMCLAGPYMPKRGNCLIYSFGINGDWSFDDAITGRFKCDLRAFDPTMKEHKSRFTRGKYITFFPLGLSDHNGDIEINGSNFPVKTFSNLLKVAKDENRVIDYLKIDIETSEWEALPNMVAEGVLDNVKQLGMETHAFYPGASDRFIDVMDALGAVGFRKWLVHWNMECQPASAEATPCHEVYFINKRFMDQRAH